MTLRSTFVATALLLIGSAVAVQEPGVLHVKVTIVDAEQRVRPVPRHALLISANPTSAAPQRIVTTADGTAELRLRPGNYTVESDQPLVFQGKTYEWAQTVDVAAGRGATLELTAANATVEAARGAATDVPVGDASSALLMQWQDSVVALWTPTARGAGFLVDARGLVLTNQRLVGAAKSVEVQLTPRRKVAARVLAADRARDAAVLWIDPGALASIKPVRLGYSDPGRPSIGEGDEVFTIDTMGFDQKSLSSGKVTKVEAQTIASDLRPDRASAGAPLLTKTGEVAAITTLDEEASSRGTYRAVRIDQARAVIASAEKAMQSGPRPAATPLPIEADIVLPEAALKEAVKRRGGGLSAYRVTAADFDVTIATPLLIYNVQHRPERTTGAATPGGRQDIRGMQESQRALEDFGNWSDYVSDNPPVVFIRATPKLVEGFWTTVGRAAASTQGVMLPAFKHVKAGFSGMRLQCGDTEVVPIHPFTIERRVDADSAVYEGLYVFDPAAIGPQCGTVRLTLFSEKAPDKGDPRIIDARVVQQIWEDFAPYRAVK